MNPGLKLVYDGEPQSRCVLAVNAGRFETTAIEVRCDQGLLYLVPLERAEHQPAVQRTVMLFLGADLDRIRQRTRYSRVAMLLHWLIAILITANVVLALSADSLSDTSARSAIDLHKSFGITVLGLAILRLLWRLAVKPPPIPPIYPAWEKSLAHLVHWLLYFLMFALPLSGWLHDSAWKDAATHPMHLYGLIEWPRIAAVQNMDAVTKEGLHTTFGDWHTWLGYVLYALVAMHILGALKHQFFDRQPEFQRMWPWGRARDNSTHLFRR